MKRKAGAAFLAVAMVYACALFVLMEPNPASWSVFARFNFVLIGVFCAAWSAAITPAA